VPNPRVRRTRPSAFYAAGFLSLSLSAAGFAQSVEAAFKIQMGGSVVLALDRPQSDGSRLVFHHYPDGLLMSIGKTTVTSVEPASAFTGQGSQGSPEKGRDSSERFRMRTSEEVLVIGKRPGLEPGDVLHLGPTASPNVARMVTSRPQLPAPTTKYIPRPGEGLPGKALFNPNRAYRPEWDSKLVPGYSMPFSNSPDDYIEGRTLPYPPGNGIQGGSGSPPTIVHDGAEPPQVLTRPGGWNPPVNNRSIEPRDEGAGSSVIAHVPDIHEVPRIGYDPRLPPPGPTPPSP
jgi:hypothetical protein